MDKRFFNSKILNRRVEEWNLENIKDYIRSLFSSVEMIEGFKLKDVNISSSRKDSGGDFNRSIYYTCSICIEDPKQNILLYKIKLPKLIYKNFFFINSQLKTPIFQLVDSHILYKHNSNFIKFKNNVLTCLYNKNEMCLNLFNKKIPIDLLLSLFYVPEELEEFFKSLPHIDSKLENIKTATYNMWEYDVDYRVTLLGDYFTTNNREKEKKAMNVLFSLDAAFEVDCFTKKFCKYDSILFELLNALSTGEKDDLNIYNKRIRFAEYILYPLIKEVYNLVLSIYNNKQNKFKMSKELIIDSCNVSDIVHHKLDLNPIGELGSLFQCTLTGPGAFKKDNVPPHLKKLDDSQFGFICPADTPDRDGCGVILNMIPTIDIDNNGKFGNPSDEVVTSYPISLTPFVHNDDATRLQMASNQEKQTILLDSSDIPMIKSGTEDVYLDHTTFLFKAEDDGEVIKIFDNYMIIYYANIQKKKLVKIGYNELHLSVVDYLTPLFKEGNKFKKNDILVESKYCKDSKLRLGHNLLTAIYIKNGENYEDGISISESIRDKFTSIHSVDLSFIIQSGQILLSSNPDEYIPLPNVGDSLKEGDVYARLKNIDTTNVLNNLNLDPYEIMSPCDCKITSIEIYPNVWNKKIVEFNDFIEGYVSKQYSKYLFTKKEISSYEHDNNDLLPHEELLLNKVHNYNKENCGKFKMKGSLINGVLVRISAIKKEKLNVGDKLSNRHGNKGVITKILKDHECPVLENGRKVDIIINTLGMISRMNIGQLFEISTGKIINKLREDISNMSNKKAYEYCKPILEKLDSSPKKEFCKQALKDIKAGNKDFSIVVPAFYKMDPKVIINILEDLDLKEKEYIEGIKNPVTTGYMYFNKLVHRSIDKYNCRSIGPYSKKTYQPLSGKSNKGGHRLGEMEVWSLLAHGSKDLLKSLLTLHSDSIQKKSEFLSNIISFNHTNNYSDETTHTNNLLKYYLNILGLKLERKDDT